jgi:hypothetical protein
MPLVLEAVDEDGYICESVVIVDDVTRPSSLLGNRENGKKLYPG